MQFYSTSSGLQSSSVYSRLISVNRLPYRSSGSLIENGSLITIDALASDLISNPGALVTLAPASGALCPVVLFFTAPAFPLLLFSMLLSRAQSTALNSDAHCLGVLVCSGSTSRVLNAPLGTSNSMLLRPAESLLSPSIRLSPAIESAELEAHLPSESSSSSSSSSHSLLSTWSGASKVPALFPVLLTVRSTAPVVLSASHSLRSDTLYPNRSKRCLLLAMTSSRARASSSLRPFPIPPW